jgi:hypothetical protein
LRSTENALRTLQNTEKIAVKANEELVIQGEILDDANTKMSDVDRNAEENYKTAKAVKKHGHLLSFLYGRRAEKKAQIDKDYAEKKSALESKKLQHQVNQETLDEHGIDALPSQSTTNSDVAATKAMQERIFRNETDRQIDENLDAINLQVDHFKVLAAQMSEEMDRQNLTLESIDVTRQHTDQTLGRAAGKIQKYAT